MHKTPIAPSSPAHSPAGAAASPASDDKPRSDYEIMAQLDGIAVDGVGEEPPLADIDDDDAPSSKVPETPGLSTAKKDTLPPARTPTESNISSKSTQLTSTTMSATPSASTIRNSPASNEADEEDEFNPLDDVSSANPSSQSHELTSRSTSAT